MACGVVSVAGVGLVVGVVGPMVWSLCLSCGDCARVELAYKMLCSAVDCARSLGSTLGLQLGVLVFQFPAPGPLEL